MALSSVRDVTRASLVQHGPVCPGAWRLGSAWVLRVQRPFQCAASLWVFVLRVAVGQRVETR